MAAQYSASLLSPDPGCHYDQVRQTYSREDNSHYLQLLWTVEYETFLFRWYLSTLIFRVVKIILITNFCSQMPNAPNIFLQYLSHKASELRYLLKNPYFSTLCLYCKDRIDSWCFIYHWTIRKERVNSGAGVYFCRITPGGWFFYKCGEGGMKNEFNPDHHHFIPTFTFQDFFPPPFF